MNRIAYFVVPLAAVIFLAGCDSQQQTALEKQAEQAAGAVQKAAEKTAAQTIRETSASAVKTWANTAKNTRQGGIGLRVKTALALSSLLDGASIDVDLQGNQIILNGEVLTSAQKVVARSLAKNIVDPQYHIVNRLKVVGPETAKNAKPFASKGY